MGRFRFLEKDWSSDLKYLIETNSGSKFVLRIADISRYDEKKKEYEMIQKFSELGFDMSMPIDFGTCNENRNVYMILSWVDGVDLEEVLPNLENYEKSAVRVENDETAVEYVKNKYRDGVDDEN